MLRCSVPAAEPPTTHALLYREKGDTDPRSVDEWAKLMEENGQPEDWHDQPQVPYSSGDEWDDRLQQERYGEEDYEEWTWDRSDLCIADGCLEATLTCLTRHCTSH